MLTDNQKSELIKVINECRDNRLKVILCKAIPLWISGEIKPIQKSFGVSIQGDEYSSYGCSCLLGTALIGEKYTSENHDLYEDLVAHFGFSYPEIDQIMYTFDGRDIKNKVESVDKIRKILFGE